MLRPEYWWQSCVEDIHALKPGSKAKACVKDVKYFWDLKLEDFDDKKFDDNKENEGIVASDYHFEGNELFLIDTDADDDDE